MLTALHLHSLCPPLFPLNVPISPPSASPLLPLKTLPLCHHLLFLGPWTRPVTPALVPTSVPVENARVSNATLPALPLPKSHATCCWHHPSRLAPSTSRRPCKRALNGLSFVSRRPLLSCSLAHHLCPACILAAAPPKSHANCHWHHSSCLAPSMSWHPCKTALNGPPFVSHRPLLSHSLTHYPCPPCILVAALPKSCATRRWHHSSHLAPSMSRHPCKRALNGPPFVSRRPLLSRSLTHHLCPTCILAQHCPSPVPAVAGTTPAVSLHPCRGAHAKRPSMDLPL